MTVRDTWPARPPRPLNVLRSSGSFTAGYVPLDFKILEQRILDLTQTITFHFHEPFFLMSGVGMVFRVVAPPVRMEGYLSRFDPAGEGDQPPDATLTFTCTEPADGPQG